MNNESGLNLLLLMFIIDTIVLVLAHITLKYGHKKKEEDVWW